MASVRFEPADSPVIVQVIFVLFIYFFKYNPEGLYF